MGEMVIGSMDLEFGWRCPREVVKGGEKGGEVVEKEGEVVEIEVGMGGGGGTAETEEEEVEEEVEGLEGEGRTSE